MILCFCHVMLEFFHRLKKAPESSRKKAAFFISLFITLVIAFVWLSSSTLPSTMLDPTIKDGFSSFTQEVGKQWDPVDSAYDKTVSSLEDLNAVLASSSTPEGL